VVVHSRSRGPVDDLVKSAARATSSPREVAAQCDVLITMLPNSPDVEQVALGKDGIIEGAKAGLIFVDMSTISPIVSQKVGTALAGGLAGSKCLEQKKPNYIAGTYNPGFKIDLHFKDLGLIMESSRALGVPLPTTAVVQELFNAMRVKGRGGLDHSGIITLLEDLAGA